MNTSRLIYRSRQFWQAIRSHSSQEDLELLSSILTPEQLELFQQMQASEQAHSLHILRVLMAQGEKNSDLHTAALLHDVGKIRAPLRVWERALVVIVKALCPVCLRKWGSEIDGGSLEELGWRRAFVVAEQHPHWGAALAAQHDVSPQAVALIARHQEELIPLGGSGSSMQDDLLRKLQIIDNNS
jgi:hypothetical protein